ncbi:MAG: pentapeptide repeat-containing protein [Solirubrobacterales bacterium]|nr:pentapeptide repeat-containing protein [Solirubrobacterales bacterium]
MPGIVVDVAFADLTSASLVGCNLFRLRGRETVLEKARCSRSNLGEARLNSARCQGAQMHETNLVSATLKEADLRGVEFCEARLQEAHLEGARLEGANFQGADLANAYFWGATFDTQTIDSIARGARRWRGNRHFDPAVRQSLEAVAV